MQHYLWYQSDGQLRGHEQYQGGFPADCDPADPATAHPVAQAIRNARMAEPDFMGFIGYNCPCDPSEEFCTHAVERVKDSYVVEGAIVRKPVDLKIVVDAVELDHDAHQGNNPYAKAPGTDITFRLRSPSTPDNTQVVLSPVGSVPATILLTPTTLTFVGGDTNEVVLKAPGQGALGAVFAVGKYVLPIKFYVRGW